jgi:hypothetical protein
MGRIENGIGWKSAGVLALSWAFVSESQAGVVGAEVVAFSQGVSSFSQNNPLAALGTPARNNAFGAMTPFNPNFSANDVVQIGIDGFITIRLSESVGVRPGVKLGVFNANGIIDVSAEGTGVAIDTAAASNNGLFGAPSRAFVQFSDDGENFQSLSSTNTLFANPSNGWKDAAEPVFYSSAGGIDPADYFKPFSGNISSFANLNFGQILTLLDGSGGGTWLDLSNLPLASFEYVRFSLPAGNSAAGSRFVIDGLTVYEPLAIAGDANGDGDVDAFDYSTIDDNFGSFGPLGDLNEDGIVDAFDYAVVDDNFGSGGGSVVLAAESEVFIPEPHSLGLIVLAAGGMLTRRSRA